MFSSREQPFCLINAATQQASKQSKAERLSSPSPLPHVLSVKNGPDK